MISKKDITKIIEKLKVFDGKMNDIIGSIIYGFQQCKKLRISSIHDNNQLQMHPHLGSFWEGFAL